MPDRMLSEQDKDLLKVIRNEMDLAQAVPSLADAQQTLDIGISESEALLRSLGYADEVAGMEIQAEQQVHQNLVIRPYDELLKDAKERYPDEIGFEDIFSREELAANREHIWQLNAEFNAVHQLDAADIAIPAMAGILGGVIDCVFGGVRGGLNDSVRTLYDKALPPATIKQLEKLAKVPYDAPMHVDNRGNTIVPINVDGLNPLFHRAVSLGHDPVLGFIFGVLDMLRGTMTTIGFDGKAVIQVMENYSNRKAMSLFEAIAKVFLHMLSDANTPADLPVPFMALFHKLQTGKIGAEQLNIAELVKSMYGQGYDFRHFSAMSIPVMIIEVVVRVSYFIKRLAEEHSFQEAIPIGLNHEKKPKLGTMLFIAHAASTAINAGKILFTDNPMNINYPQWLSFARYAVKQAKWGMIDKPRLRDQFVMNAIRGEWDSLSRSIDYLWDGYADNAILTPPIPPATPAPA